MKHLHFLLLGVVAIFAWSCSTAPTKDEQLAIRKMFTEPLAPIYDISMLRSGAVDLLYCSGSFRHKNGRWPTDYSELSTFVKQSDGYLMLGEYERVDLKPLPNDGFEIGYIRLGHTNEMKFTLSGPAEAK
jgi:hypothetical protein